MTHGERSKRRAGIAEAVKGGMDRREAARHFGVALQTVNHACTEYGLPPGYSRQMAPSTFTILASLFQRDKTYREIADEMGVSHQRVQQIHKEATKAGIPVPDRS